MNKWLLSFVAASLTCGSAIPVLADTTTTNSYDHASPYLDLYSLAVGTTTKVHINFFGNTTPTTQLQVHTTLGSLNGQGSDVTVTPSNGSFPDLTLTSNVAGTANITISENGNLIGSTQTTFAPGPIQAISVVASPSNPMAGGTDTITIVAKDAYGNPVTDNTVGTTFTLSASAGQLTAVQANSTTINSSSILVSTHDGEAQAFLSDANPDNVTVTVTASNLPANTTINGQTNVTTVSVPVKFTIPQGVNLTPFNDFGDANLSTPQQLDAERELSAAGVFHGDSNHNFTPTTTMTRAEFAEVVAQYMGLGTVASNLNGTSTKFADVDPSAWYDGAVAADATFGYVHGDGTNYYPQKSISYAEVAMILLNNLGVQTTGAWPNNAMSGGQSNGLFKGLGSFTASAPATRGDVAIMVQNAMHLVPPNGGLNTYGKTMESEELGYTWYGVNQTSTVIGIPGSGTVLGNEVLIQTPTKTTTIYLANTVQVVGASTLSDLVNKNIEYLTNAVGLVTYIKVAQ